MSGGIRSRLRVKCRTDLNRCEGDCSVMDEKMEDGMKRIEYAEELHKKKYNCCQSVVCAFADCFPGM